MAGQIIWVPGAALCGLLDLVEDIAAGRVDHLKVKLTPPKLCPKRASLAVPPQEVVGRPRDDVSINAPLVNLRLFTIFGLE